MVIHDSKFPTYRKILRAVFNWRNARRALLAGAVLATLATAFYLEELWRGQRDWEAYRREFEAQGGTLDLHKLSSPPVPDEQNFAMTPVLKPLFSESSPEQFNKYSTELGTRLEWPTAKDKDPHTDMPSGTGSWPLATLVDLEPWRKFLDQPDILQALKKFDPILSEISVASRRPFYRPALDVRKLNFAGISLFIHTGRIYVVRALAELADGQTDRAADDTVTIFQLAKAMGNEPFMMSQLTACSIIGQGLQVVWEGLVAHRWSDAQLAELSRELEKLDLLADELRTARFEQAIFDDRLAQAISGPAGLDPWFKVAPSDPQWQFRLVEAFFPRGWIYSDRIALLQNYQNCMSAIDAPNHRLDLVKVRAIEGNPAQEFIIRRNLFDDPFKTWTANVVPNLAGVSRTFARIQTSVDEAQVACALERFRLASGQLPEKLDELAPKFIVKLPPDIISGGPLHYQRKANGHFLLYAVGENGTDDGGITAINDDHEVDWQHGDWVWPDAVKQP